MVEKAGTNFERALLGVDARLRKLLEEMRVLTLADLRQIDPWSLLKKRGVGRQAVRDLVQFMRAQGLEVGAYQSASGGKRLAIYIPLGLIDPINAAAAHEGLKPAEWVLSVIRAALAARG